MRKKGMVLLVDDNLVDSTILAAALQELGLSGCEIQITNSSEAAYQTICAARKGSLRLILSDLEMPGRTGLDLLAATRAHRPTFKVPFVLVSSRARDLDVTTAMAQYQNIVGIKKPVCMQSLEQAISKLAA